MQAELAQRWHTLERGDEIAGEQPRYTQTEVLEGGVEHVRWGAGIAFLTKAKVRQGAHIWKLQIHEQIAAISWANLVPDGETS
jgi:hypothetical protein